MMPTKKIHVTKPRRILVGSQAWLSDFVSLSRSARGTSAAVIAARALRCLGNLSPLTRDLWAVTSDQPRLYSPSLTCSIHSTTFPSSSS